MTVDKRTIGITSANERVLATVIEAGCFASELEAAKFAMGVAIDQGVGVGVTEGANTKWNVGTADSDQSLKAIIEAMYPEVVEPYRLIEHLMNEGLQRLDGGQLPPDVVGVLFKASTT
jgi:hypothetical protein